MPLYVRADTEMTAAPVFYRLRPLFSVSAVDPHSAGVYLWFIVSLSDSLCSLWQYFLLPLEKRSDTRTMIQVWCFESTLKLKIDPWRIFMTFGLRLTRFGLATALAVTTLLFSSATTNAQDDGVLTIGSKAPKLDIEHWMSCLLYTSPSPRDQRGSRMPSSA